MLFMVSGSFISCDNELDIVAPYKEIGVVYGLLNPTDSIHYVRIHKAYLGEGNALVMAQNPDSIYYPDILDVRMQRVINGNVVEDFPLTRFTGDPLDPGTFPSTPNILYKTNGEKIYRDSDYKLLITNTETGYYMESETPIIDSLLISRPPIQSSFPIPWAGSNPILVEYTTGMDAKVSNLTVRFNYREEDITTGLITNEFVDWKFLPKDVKNPQVPETVTMQLDGQAFFRFIGDAVKVDPNVKRYALGTDFIITSGAEFLANYININSATTSILTSIPVYSNIDGGTGIFSSRYVQVSPNKPLDANSLSYLSTGPYTDDLGFQ